MNNITYPINIINLGSFDWQASHSLIKSNKSSQTYILPDHIYSVYECSNPMKREEDHVESELGVEKVSYSDRLVLPTTEGIHLVHINNVIRLEADKNYTVVHILDQTPIIVSKTLKEVERTLDPDRFFRIHQSHTVDLKKVQTYHRGRGGSIRMDNGDLLPVSKYKRDSLLEKLM